MSGTSCSITVSVIRSPESRARTFRPLPGARRVGFSIVTVEMADRLTPTGTSAAAGLPGRTVLPMTAEEIRAAGQAAVTPAQRLAIAPAAVHAARPKAIRELTLDDIDLPSRRITIAGHRQRLGELTCNAAAGVLALADAAWPAHRNMPPRRPGSRLRIPASDTGIIFCFGSVDGITTAMRQAVQDRFKVFSRWAAVSGPLAPSLPWTPSSARPPCSPAARDIAGEQAVMTC